MINDLIKSIKSNLYERSTSPLFGTFMVTWCVWNFKTLFVLFSNMSIEQKFNYIELILYPNLLTCILKGIIYPLVTTILFIFVYPYPAREVYKFWRNRKRELKAIRQQIEDETPLTIEESRKLRRDTSKLVAEYEGELSRKDTELENYKKMVTSLEEEMATLNLRIKDLEKPTPEAEREIDPNLLPEDERARQLNSFMSKETIEKEQLHILKLITDAGGTLLDNQILAKSGFSKVKTEYYLEELKNRNYTGTEYDARKGGTIYKLTNKGRKLVIEEGIAK